MAVIRRSARTALSELALLQREVNQLFERLAEAERAERPDSAAWLPSADVYESGGNLKVVVEVPGLVPESLKLACKDHELVIVGERREEAGGRRHRVRVHGTATGPLQTGHPH